MLRWLLGAAGGVEVFDLLSAAQGIAVSRLTLIEVRRVLTRLESSGELQPAPSARVRAQLTAELVRWDIIELSEPVWLRAEERFPIEPLRTLAALHLASALHYRAAAGELHMLSFDARVLDNWRALGLGVALPTASP